MYSTANTNKSSQTVKVKVLQEQGTFTCTTQTKKKDKLAQVRGLPHIKRSLVIPQSNKSKYCTTKTQRKWYLRVVSSVPKTPLYQYYNQRQVSSSFNDQLAKVSTKITQLVYTTTSKEANSTCYPVLSKKQKFHGTTKYQN